MMYVLEWGYMESNKTETSLFSSARSFHLIFAGMLILFGCQTGVIEEAYYTNPLPLVTSSGEEAESCADPSVIQGGEGGEVVWYMYCTTDPLNSSDRDAFGGLVFHLIPTFQSHDLVNWS